MSTDHAYWKGKGYNFNGRSDVMGVARHLFVLFKKGEMRVERNSTVSFSVFAHGIGAAPDKKTSADFTMSPSKTMARATPAIAKSQAPRSRTLR